MAILNDDDISRVVQETGIARLELERRVTAGEVKVNAAGAIPRSEVARLKRERTTPGLTVSEAAAVLGHRDESYTYRRIRAGALPAWAEEAAGGLSYKVLPAHIEWFTARHRLSGTVIPAAAVPLPTPPAPPRDTLTIAETMAALGTTSRAAVYSLLYRGRLTQAHDTTEGEGMRVTGASVRALIKERAEGRTPVGGYRPAKDAPDGKRYRVPGGIAAHLIKQGIPPKSGYWQGFKDSE